MTGEGEVRVAQKVINLLTSDPSDEEATRMLESMQDLIQQKQKQETVAFEQRRREEGEESVVFKKPKPIRRLSKKDISAPCNFKHVSGW